MKNLDNLFNINISGTKRKERAYKNSFFNQIFLDYLGPTCFNTMYMEIKKMICLTPKYAKKKKM